MNKWTRSLCFLLSGILAALLTACYKVYYGTIRFRVIDDAWKLPPKDSDAEPVILVFWHSKNFLLPPFCSGFKAGVLTLPDWKNKIYESMCRRLGFHTVEVLSPVLALFSLQDLLQKGYHVGLALDGPRGPAGTAKPGAVALAESSGRALIAVNIRMERSFRLWWRWDRYEIPYPFSRATGVLSPPIIVEAGDTESACAQIKNFLTEL